MDMGADGGATNAPPMGSHYCGGTMRGSCPVVGPSRPRASFASRGATGREARGYRCAHLRRGVPQVCTAAFARAESVFGRGGGCSVHRREETLIPLPQHVEATTSLRSMVLLTSLQALRARGFY